MSALDYTVLVVYFLAMALIGYVCSKRVKKQEDFFLGGRSFGKILQAFAAFGAGTGAYDPVTLGRTTFTSGLSGIWSVLLWLFVTPFYWISGVWYRRMRHLTLGDWFVERFNCVGLGAAYAVFALFFNIVYLSVSFSAVGKICPPLLGFDSVTLPGFVDPVPVEAVLVPIIALVVLVYGALGGLRAAYWTDLIQGIFIILLSILLIPSGLAALVERFGGPESSGILAGFEVMHDRLPEQYFRMLDTPQGGEFPLHYIVAITVLNLVGVVVQPHFIATGGGSAKSETAARVGLVAGNFMKRLCTVGWALTGLIVLALFAESVSVNEDPDRAWGFAAVEILGPLGLGLVGLMLACLLAALMSSADCYMLVTSGLVVRNLYVPFLRRDVSERECLLAARIVSVVILVGGAWVSLAFLNVFDQLKIAWELPVIFAAPFWVGMFWRRATRNAAWFTILATAMVFFILPIALPLAWPSLRENPEFLGTNHITRTTVVRPAAPADVARRNAAIAAWTAAESEARSIGDADVRVRSMARLGESPDALVLGEPFEDSYTTGGKALFWGKVEPIEGEATTLREVSRVREGATTIVESVREGSFRGAGYFKLDLYLYQLIGIDLASFSSSALETLRLPARVLTPFVLMIVFSLLTRRGDPAQLDRYFVKMKTPVAATREEDAAELERSYADPRRFDDRKLFPGSSWEFQRPRPVDVIGFVLSLFGCFAIIWLAVAVASIGS